MSLDHKAQGYDLSAPPEAPAEDPYRRGWYNALDALRDWIEQHRHDRPVITPLVLAEIERMRENPPATQPK